VSASKRATRSTSAFATFALAASGTLALAAGLIGSPSAGDEVLVPAHTYMASALPSMLAAAPHMWTGMIALVAGPIFAQGPLRQW
jgi:dTDP-4-amino-4,6-dideoxygalactose transaminase